MQLITVVPRLGLDLKVAFYIPEAHLEHSQLSKMQLFVKIVKGFQVITIFVKISIFDV